MADRAAAPVTAGLSQLARMDRFELNRVMRQLCRQHPAFREQLQRVVWARGIALASGLVLALAVVFLCEQAPLWLVGGLVLAGLVGFGYVAVTLTDNRFDLLLAVLGAHSSDELRGALDPEQVHHEQQEGGAARRSRAFRFSSVVRRLRDGLVLHTD